MSTSQLVTFIYAAVLHVAALVSLVILVAVGKVSWVEGGPIITALVGLGAGVPLVIAGTNTSAAAAEPVAPAEPAAPVA